MFCFLQFKFAQKKDYVFSRLIYIYIYIYYGFSSGAPFFSIQRYTGGVNWVTIFEYSNILFNYRISIRLCDYFLKVYQGLTIKTV